MAAGPQPEPPEPLGVHRDDDGPREGDRGAHISQEAESELRIRGDRELLGSGERGPVSRSQPGERRGGRGRAGALAGLGDGGDGGVWWRLVDTGRAGEGRGGEGRGGEGRRLVCSEAGPTHAMAAWV